MELGFHVTLVRDGTAARSKEAYDAALNIDGPTYAHEIVTTAELVAAMKASTGVLCGVSPKRRIAAGDSVHMGHAAAEEHKDLGP
jgi:hypothetical protein